MSVELEIGLGLVGGALVLGLFILATRLETLISRVDLRIDRLEEGLRER